MTAPTDRARAGGSPSRASGPEQMRSNEQQSLAFRVALGKAARLQAPLESHAQFDPGTRDPIRLLLGQARSRVPELVPVRHARMLVSPFSYFRGAALPMAADLADLPMSGLRVQVCGDAHLSNFGGFASPERRLIFDLNDFDETLPGPFEWDVKRLAASLAVVGRGNGYSTKSRRKIVVAAVESYRTAMREFADRSVLDVWYAHQDVESAVRELRSHTTGKRFKNVEGLVAKARTRDSMQAQSKLATLVAGRPQIVSNPPMIVPIDEVFGADHVVAVEHELRAVLAKYRRTLPSHRRHLLAQFTLRQVARKVVGVGSVGTRAWILLLTARDGVEPLFLQAKEAQRSVLASYVGRSHYDNEGERVVAGQNLMQAHGDIFLGWTRSTGQDRIERDYYLRQLRDWKFSLPTEQMLPTGMVFYARLCGWSLARAHARSGDRIALAAYLGGSGKFDQAIADFAESYADQNERDFTALQDAVADGRVETSSAI
jgi:uncharacterized protein (DUF2252 family)